MSYIRTSDKIEANPAALNHNVLGNLCLINFCGSQAEPGKPDKVGEVMAHKYVAKIVIRAGADNLLPSSVVCISLCSRMQE